MEALCSKVLYMAMGCMLHLAVTTCCEALADCTTYITAMDDLLQKPLRHIQSTYYIVTGLFNEGL